MALQASDLADLITTTQNELGRARFTEIATDIQDHCALRELLNESRVQFTAGPNIQWNLMTESSGSARDTGLYEVDQTNVSDVMATANIPYRHMTANYSIERREIALNRAPAQIVDLVRIRRNDAMISLAEHIEKRFWGVPANPTDDKKIYGVGYWIVDATDGSSGFNGGAPTNFTDVAGVNPSTVTRWKNWSAVYSDTITPMAAPTYADGTGTGNPAGQTSGGTPDSTGFSDMVVELREAYVKCNFRPIPNVSYSDYNKGNRYGLYTNYKVISYLEEVLARRNDNLGMDVGATDGKVVFRGIPLPYCPYLDSNVTISGSTAYPIYGINWGVFESCFLEGEYMRESGPDTAPNQHTVFTTHVDLSMNIRCTDRRRNFVLKNANGKLVYA
jgi:hypothetical protein